MNTDVQIFFWDSDFIFFEYINIPRSMILTWRILWTEEPGELLSIGLHRVGHDWSDLACMHALEKEMATHSSILSWRIPGTGESGGLLSMGSHRVGHDWSNLAAAAAWLDCVVVLFKIFGGPPFTSIFLSGYINLHFYQ